MEPEPTVPTHPDLGVNPRAPRRLSSRRRRFAVIAALCGAAIVSVAIWQTVSTSGTTGTVLVGQTSAPAPTFVLPDLRYPGHTISRTSFEGKFLVVNFWASWCVPCRTEMPILQAASNAAHGRIAFLGIDTNDTRADALSFLRKVHAAYPSAFDGDGATAKTYGLFGLPTTVFISPTGKVVGRHLGEFNADTLQAALHQAFPSA